MHARTTEEINSAGVRCVVYGPPIYILGSFRGRNSSPPVERTACSKQNDFCVERCFITAHQKAPPIKKTEKKKFGQWSGMKFVLTRSVS